MKSQRGFVLSLCLNLGLLAAVGYLIKSRSAVSEPASPIAPTASPRIIVKKETAPAKPAPGFDWRMVESEDYKKYIANLRAIGCPEETIRDIITADVDKLFETRRQALLKPDEGFKFWKTGQSMFGAVNPDQLQEEIKQKRQLAQEKRVVLKELLGIDLPDRPDAVVADFNPYERLLGFLSPDKRAQLVDLEQKYSVLRMKKLQGGAMPTADENKKFEAEKSAEMAKLLTAEELEEYHLRMSPTAMTMRMQLGAFDPTEQEFREVFRLKKKFDDEHGAFMGFNTGDTTANEKKAAAEKDLEEQIKKTLGEQRFTEYKREQDWSYRGALQAAEQNGLPKEAAVKVYDMKKVAEQQAGKLRQDANLSDEERQAALRAIRAETEKAVAQALGEKGFEFYRKQMGGYWIQTLGPTGSPP